MINLVSLIQFWRLDKTYNIIQQDHFYISIRVLMIFRVNRLLTS